MSRQFLFIFILLTQIVFAKPMPLSGRVMELSGIPVENENTRFNVKIKNIATCVLFEEEFLTDLSGSNGYFKIVLTNGTSVFNGNGFDIFRGKTYGCKDGTTWSASNTDVRLIEISLKVGDQPWVNFSSDTINSIAYANESDYLNGKNSSDFIQTSSSTTQLKVDDLLNQYTSIIELVNGLNSTYAKQSLVDTALLNKQNVLSYTPINPGNNLSELTNFAQARSNLGLGTLATKSLVTDSDISSVDWIKVGNKPTTYPPSTHSHNVSEIISLSNLLNSKVDKSTFTCSSTQVLLFNSILDSFSCSDILTGGDLSGNIASATVVKIQGKLISPNNPSNGDSLVYNSSNQRWEPTAINNNSVPKVFAGEVITFPGNCPTGTVLANGQSLDQSLNQDLFTAFGCSFGCPTGTTFKVPDYRGTFLRMSDNGAGIDPGRGINTFQNDELKTHNHPVNDPGHSHFTSLLNADDDINSGNPDYALTDGDNNYGHQNRFTNNTVTNITILNTGGTETRPKNYSINYCVRLKNGY